MYNARDYRNITMAGFEAQRAVRAKQQFEKMGKESKNAVYFHILFNFL